MTTTAEHQKSAKGIIEEMRRAHEKKRNPFPIAKRRNNGEPAIWFTFSHWLMLRYYIRSEYLKQREYMGGRRARIEAKTADVHDAWPFDVNSAEDALRLYSIGLYTYQHVSPDSPDMAPEQLVAIGDKRELAAYDEQMKRIKAKAQLAEKAA